MSSTGGEVVVAPLNYLARYGEGKASWSSSQDSCFHSLMTLSTPPWCVNGPKLLEQKRCKKVCSIIGRQRYHLALRLSAKYSLGYTRRRLYMLPKARLVCRWWILWVPVLDACHGHHIRHISLKCSYQRQHSLLSRYRFRCDIPAGLTCTTYCCNILLSHNETITLLVHFRPGIDNIVLY